MDECNFDILVAKHSSGIHHLHSNQSSTVGITLINGSELEIVLAFNLLRSFTLGVCLLASLRISSRIVHHLMTLYRDVARRIGMQTPLIHLLCGLGEETLVIKIGFNGETILNYTLFTKY